MENLTLKQKIVFMSVMIIMIITIGYYFIQDKNDEEFDIYSAVENMEENYIEEKETKIIVHIVGCVENEGIVELKQGARIADAIEAAGGLTSDANLTNVYLSVLLQVGQKIKIPINIEDITSEEDLLWTEPEKDKVNINTATQTELETLTRYRTIYSIKDY